MKFNDHDEKSESTLSKMKQGIKRFASCIGILFKNIVLGLLGIAVGISLIYFAGRTIKSDLTDNHDDPRNLTVADVRHKLKDIGEFATEQDTYSGHIDDTDGKARKLLNTDINIPLTKNYLGMTTFEGTVKVGYNVNEIIDNTSIDQISKVITIKLPEPIIISNELNESKSKYQERNNILNPLDGSDYTELEIRAKELGLSQSINEHDLYKKAEKSAKKTIKKSLNSIDGYKVIFA